MSFNWIQSGMTPHERKQYEAYCAAVAEQQELFSALLGDDEEEGEDDE